MSEVELESGVSIIPVQFKEKQPFDFGFWQSFGYIRCKQRPISSVQKVAFTPATETDILIMDPGWIETSNFAKGQINLIPLVPAAAVGNVQATIGTGGGAAFITIFSGKHWIPALIEVVYTAGFPNRQMPRVINELIGAQAAINILSMIAATYRVQSYSMGTDGLSQSVSTMGPLLFKQRIDELMMQKHGIIKRIKTLFALDCFSDFS